MRPRQKSPYSFASGFLLDRQLRVLWSSSLDKDYEPQQFIGMCVLERVPLDDQARVADLLNRCIRDGKRQSYTVKAASPFEPRSSRPPRNLFIHKVHVVRVNLPPVALFGLTNIVPDAYEQAADAELDMLALLADDHDIGQAAALLKIARSTGHAYLGTLKDRLGKATLYGLLADAVRKGVV